jgi:hypothetical protein
MDASSVEIQDDLYSEAKYGYFASPTFHARLKKMNESAMACPPGGRAQRRWMENKLGCKYADFIAFLEKIADADGVADVPCGDGKCIAFEVESFRKSLH